MLSAKAALAREGGWPVAYEVNTDCGDVGLGVSVVGKSQEQSRLSNTGVSDEEQLEEVVVSNKMSTAGSDGFVEPGRSTGCRRKAGQEEMALEVGVSTRQDRGSVKATYYSGFMMTVLQVAGQIWALG